MKHHPQPKEPKSFLQGQELELLSSYVSSYMGTLRTAKANTSAANTNYLYGGKGPTIVLLHGIGSKKTHYRSTMKALIDAGYRVIAPDVPGIYPQIKLRSSKHNLRNLSNWIKDFTDTLGLNHYTLLGNSVSASLAAYHAELHPEDINKLILLSMPATFNEQGEDLKTAIATLLLGLKGVQDVDEIVSHCFFVPPKLPLVVKKRIYADIIANQGFIEKLLGDIKESQLQLSNKIKRIQAPTLLISGEEDAVCPPDFICWLESQIPDTEVHIIAKSRHLTFIERHRLVIKLISDFLVEGHETKKLSPTG